jgi:Ca2+-binding EF-hand superfamily protein
MSVMCCFSTGRVERAGAEAEYVPLTREGSQQPGPREPAKMVGLREHLTDVEFAIIETGGELTTAQMEYIFEKLDADDDGKLDRDELKSLVRLLWDLQDENKAVVESFNEMFEKLDEDKNGTIDRQELIKGLPRVIKDAHAKKLHSQAIRRLRKRGANSKGKNISAQHIETLFDDLDKDGNGELGDDELNEIIQQLVPRCSCTAGGSHLEFAKEKLKNSGGKITKAEFGPNVAYVLDAICAMNNRAPAPKQPQQTTAVACFGIGGRLSEPVKHKLWDAFNHEVDSHTNETDDTLTHKEIAPLVYYLWEHLGEDKQVIELFKKTLDMDGDGNITKKEFMGAADKAFAMAAATWPRPSPPEVVASMRVYGTDMCMQGECCARIASVCTEDNAESPRALNVALFVAHGAIEASVKALEAARRLDDLAVAEAACKALAALLQSSDACPSPGTESMVSQLLKVDGVLEILIGSMEAHPDNFELVLGVVRVLGIVARQNDPACGLTKAAEHPDTKSISRIRQAAQEAAEAYKREAPERATEADRLAVKNSVAMETAVSSLDTALWAEQP